MKFRLRIPTLIMGMKKLWWIRFIQFKYAENIPFSNYERPPPDKFPG